MTVTHSIIMSLQKTTEPTLICTCEHGLLGIWVRDPSWLPYLHTHTNTHITTNCIIVLNSFQSAWQCLLLWVCSWSGASYFLTSSFLLVFSFHNLSLCLPIVPAHPPFSHSTEVTLPLLPQSNLWLSLVKWQLRAAEGNDRVLQRLKTGR